MLKLIISITCLMVSITTFAVEGPIFTDRQTGYSVNDGGHVFMDIQMIDGEKATIFYDDFGNVIAIQSKKNFEKMKAAYEKRMTEREDTSTWIEKHKERAEKREKRKEVLRIKDPYDRNFK